MSFLKLCNDDPLLNLMRDTFQANPIKLPEERIQPLIVLSVTGKKTTFIGKLEHLLVNGNPLSFQILDSQLPNVTATQSKAIETKLGLKVMDSFLKGFGSKSASIEHVFKGINKVSFSFQDVHRKYIERSELMNVLSKRKFDSLNAVNQVFIEEKAKCVIITDIITSNNFSIKAEEENSQQASFDIPEIQGIISAQNNKIKVSASGNKEISFKGPKALSFAFVGAQVKVDLDGRVFLDSEPDKMFLTKNPYDNQKIELPPFYLIDESGLIEIE